MSDPSNSELLGRIDVFGKSLVNHPKLGDAFIQAFNQIRRPSATIVEVMGPTGVGKTTLVKKLFKDGLDFFGPEMASNPGLVPVIHVEAAAPERGIFEWPDFYLRVLRALQEPMVDCKTLPPHPSAALSAQKKQTLSALRWATEQALRHRGTRVIIVDEAQHFTKANDARRLVDQMDTIKSLSSQTKVMFVLIGTYELRLLLNQNGQLARRIHSVHFGRYNYELDPERQAFVNILGMFENRLPLAATGLLTSQPEFIYQKCLGCVGILKEWLRAALEHAAHTDRNHLSKGDLAATALPPASLAKIFEEIQEGEATLANQAREAADWTLKLGLTSTVTAKSAPTAPSTRQVGQRKPHRDLVGTNHGIHAFTGSH